MNTDKTAPHWPHGSDFPEGGPHAEVPSMVEEIRERWASNDVPWPDEPNTEPSAPEDIAFLLAKVERLTADLAQTRAAAREQLAEKDRIIDEVMEESAGRLAEQHRIGRVSTAREAALTQMVESLKKEVRRLSLTPGTCSQQNCYIHDGETCAQGFSGVGACPSVRRVVADLDVLPPMGRELPDGQAHLNCQLMSNPADLPAELGEVRVRFGLDAQGHVPTIERMLAEGASWEDIGAAIGWHAPTAKQHWEVRQAALADTLPTREETAAELRAAGLEPGKVGRDLRLRLEAAAEDAEPSADPEPLTLEDGWCSGCDVSIEALGGPIRQSKSYDSPYREWACPECGHTEDDPDLTLTDLRDVMVEGWEMPKAPHLDAKAMAYFGGDGDDTGWSLVWSADEAGCEGHIPWPFREGVDVTADMLRALGFTVEEG